MVSRKNEAGEATDATTGGEDAGTG